MRNIFIWMVAFCLLTECPGQEWHDVTTPGGARVRVESWGNGRWRLRTADAQGAFREDGAVQALRRYLGETMPERAIGPEATRVEIAEKPFGIRFVAANGKVVSEITDIRSKSGRMEICGKLAEKEGVYGGGIRFDRLNRRGTTIDLNTSDGWNNDNTTYLAIPMFVTTRGGGFFVNRYETMTANFGKDINDEWKICLNAQTFDGWFFASSTMKDALAGYASLVGKSEMEPEWSRGPIICRYAPDLTFFEGQRMGRRRKQQVMAFGVKDIFNAHVAMGVKPTAMLLEAWPMTKVLEDAAVRKELERTGEYLSENGARMMCYASVGNVISMKEPSFKQEYLVHADVTMDGKTRTNTCEIIQLYGKTINPDAARKRPRKYLDITNPEAWNWYIEKIWMPLARAGIRGVKIDFCEQLPDDGVDYNGSMVTYHWKDPSVFAGAAVHHAYPSFFNAKLYREMNRRLASEGGFLCFARGGGIGANLAPYYWAGDQVREFRKLRSQLLSVLNAGMSGMPYLSYDMAGYQYGNPKPDKDLESRVFARGTEATAFMTCMQTHGFVLNAYEMTDEVQDIYRKFCGMRKILEPKFKMLLAEARGTCMPPVRPLVLEFPDDENTWDIGDEFMLGGDMLIAPVLDDATEREVYLPKGVWKAEDGTIYDLAEGGRKFTIPAPLGRIPTFYRK